MRLLPSFVSLHLLIFSFGQSPNPGRVDTDSFYQAMIKAVTGKPFPTFVVANEEGIINNDSLKGKIVLINFWFEGCHPCVTEFPALNELAQKLKGNKGFEFISFTFDNPETIKRVQETYKLDFKVYYSKECHRLNQGLGYPLSMVLDRQGIVKYAVGGGSLNPEKAREFVMTTLLTKIQQELQL